MDGQVSPRHVGVYCLACRSRLAATRPRWVEPDEATTASEGKVENERKIALLFLYF